MNVNLDFPLGTAIMDLVLSHRALTTKKIRKLGLYPGQDLVLLELLREDNRSQNELVKALCVDHSTIAKSVKRLLKSEVIRTNKSEKDKRVTIISLTSKGRQVATQAAEIWNEVEKTAFKNFSPEDAQTFIQFSKSISANFTDKVNELNEK
ncbi:MarR family winged helix-turn-helix transcriptional regulator [Pediococcus siamensis]|uniref:MarR family winged helix-turn-helix transcriptional regulator n=1 Tax=Pediococcus siamensis TaxID=381829 RepID=UPI0039A171F4